MNGARSILALLLSLYLGLSSSSVILPNSDDVSLAQSQPDLSWDDSDEWDDPEWDSPEWDSPEWDSPEWDSPEWDSPEWDSPEWDGPEWVDPEQDSESSPMNCDENGNFIGACTSDLLPRCGSDGVTYEGGCEVANAQCKNPDLFMMFSGPCHDYVAVPQVQDCTEGDTWINEDGGDCRCQNGRSLCYERSIINAGERAQLIPVHLNNCKYPVGEKKIIGKYNKDYKKCENCHKKCHTGEFDARTCKCKTNPFCKP